MNETDVAVIILEKDEALHIRRCIERLKGLAPRQIFVVDCHSTDGSDRMAAAAGADVVYHDWPGTQAAQLNWALDNLPLAAEWILRLDADEYLTPDTAAKLKSALSGDGLKAVNGLTLELKRRFMGGEIKHGTRGIRLVRIWRRGRGRVEERAMDERVAVDGETRDFDGAFYDDNLNTFEWWRGKHRGYAVREAGMALSGGANPNKRLYYRLPPYLRAFAYFCCRYFIRLGFLDGVAGWRWHFWQGLWYRCLVDREIGRMKKGK